MQYIVLFFLSILSTVSSAADSIFNEALSIINQNYFQSLKTQDINKAAIKGIVQSLDNYSTYINKSDAEKLSEIMNNEYGGIGIEITTSRRCPMILDIADESPAEVAGLEKGDIIVKSGNKELCDLNIKAVRDILTGKPGSLMSIEIDRDNKKFSYDIVRRKIKIIPYSVQLLDKIVYIKIKHFTNDLAKNIRDEYRKIKSDRLVGVILDLRFNPGGLFDEALNISSLFLRNHTKIVSFRLKDKSEDFYSVGQDITDGLPIVVIINSLSASASEIVASALQDNKRAQIIGEKSFGKGSVQKTFNLKNGDIIKLTIGIYCTPLGKEIQNIGVQPDIYAIDNILLPEQKPLKEIDNKSELIKREILADKKYDYQIIRAIDLIQTINFVNQQSLIFQ